MKRILPTAKALVFAEQSGIQELLDAVGAAIEEGWEVITIDLTEDGQNVQIAPADGAMVGWFLPDWLAEQYEVEGGETDLHVTTVYLGDMDDLTLDQQRALIGVVSEVAQETPMMYGRIHGTGTFPMEDGGTVWWAEPHIEGLAEFRDRLLAALAGAGIPFETKHPEYQPHITLAYLEEGVEPPAVTIADRGPFTIDEITVALGTTRHRVRLGEMDTDAYEAWVKETWGEEYWDVIDAGSVYRPLVKSVVQTERRFTLGPWYIPDVEDAHGEWTDADNLQAALWKYVDSGYRTTHLQHMPDVAAGRWVEIMALPWPMEVPVIDVNGEVAAHVYPAGTVLMGVIWEPWAWELVKEGKITGYSIGGYATRVDEDPPGGDGVSAEQAAE